MTVKEMKARVAVLWAEIVKIGELTDDESMADEEFDRLMREADKLETERGELQNKIDILDVKTLTRVSDWSASFLDSFAPGTRKITNKQAEIFRRFNNCKPFIFHGRRFDCLGPNYRVGFAGLVVTKIDF